MRLRCQYWRVAGSPQNSIYGEEVFTAAGAHVTNMWRCNICTNVRHLLGNYVTSIALNCCSPAQVSTRRGASSSGPPSNRPRIRHDLSVPCWTKHLMTKFYPAAVGVTPHAPGSDKVFVGKMVQA